MIILKGMDEMDSRQLALEQLLKKADIQGYVIFDDIMSAALHSRGGLAFRGCCYKRNYYL